MNLESGLICELRKGTYYDSVFLMQISEKLLQLDSVTEAIVSMGTETNKKILTDLEMLHGDLIGAQPDDLLIAIKTRSDQDYDEIKNHLHNLFDQRKVNSNFEEFETFPTLSTAISASKQIDLVLISTPGQFAFDPAKQAIENNIPVLIFSDHVDLDQEIELKKLGEENDILVMGPDCGASNLKEFALALSSKFAKGTIGIIGASGSGVQEVGALLTSMGHGVSQVIGTGGRDLNDEIAASSMLKGLRMLSEDQETQLIIIIGKKPSQSAEIKLSKVLRNYPKPVICCFLGSSPEPWNKVGAWFSPTLTSAVLAAISIFDGEKRTEDILSHWLNEVIGAIRFIREELADKKGYLRGVFGAGTFSTQAQLLSIDLLSQIYSNNPVEGAELLNNPFVSFKHSFVDVGDEVFTQGRPHPVIDLLPYKLKIGKDIGDEAASIILLDVILGPAVYKNPAKYLTDVIADVIGKRNNKIVFVTSICGTDLDPQNATDQKNILIENGVIVLPSSSLAAITSVLSLTELSENDALDKARKTLKAFPPMGFNKTIFSAPDKSSPSKEKIHIINIGTTLLAQSLIAQGASVSQVDWSPPAGGNLTAIKLLRATSNNKALSEKIIDANEEAFNLLINGQPVWVDVKKAGEVIPGFERNLILHAGPKIAWNDMLPAQKGGIIGGALLEGLAEHEDDVESKIMTGEIKIAPGLDFFTPCGAMASTTWSMPVAVVEDKNTGKFGYTALQEGPSMESLRWGYFSKPVLERWKWMCDDFGPALSKALQKIDGIQMRPIISRSLQMGDENHSRELSTNTIIALELASPLFETGNSFESARSYLNFLKTSERFALHVLMASAMSVLRSISNIPYCSVVTAMGGNGIEIGIKVSGTNKSWFTSQAPIPVGKYLNPAWTSEDATPFAGDSCVLEVYGLGGMAAAASPSVALLTGGNFFEAVKRNKSMWEITIGRNSVYQIPFLDFEGVPTGINILKVLETGIEPVSHAGIALKKGGQAGAGVASIPIECFSEAFTEFINIFGEN